MAYLFYCTLWYVIQSFTEDMYMYHACARQLACPKPTAGKCLLIGCRLVNTASYTSSYSPLGYFEIVLYLVSVFFVIAQRAVTELT